MNSKAPLKILPINAFAELQRNLTKAFACGPLLNLGLVALFRRNAKRDISAKADFPNLPNEF